MFRKAAIILIVLLLGISASAKSALKVGSPSPSFDLPNLEGKTVSLKDYLGKKVIVLSFFASWSKSCQQEILFLQDLSKNKGLKILGVSFDRKLKNLKSFINENKIGFEILHDKKLKTLKDFRILIIPTLFVIDKEGIIKSIYVDFDQNVKKAVSKEVQKLLVP
ncbi:MAG: peroxiredoxin family protein [Candidatus Margulisiibacteriota bacterium]